MDCSKSDGCRECEQHFDGKVNFSQPHIKPIYLRCVQFMHFELFLDRKAHLDVKINRRLPVWYIYCSISDKCIFSKLVHSAHQLKKDDGTLTTDDTEKAINYVKRLFLHNC